MEERILQLLAEICETDEVLENRDLDIFEEGLMDSLGFAEFLVALEDELQVVIAPSEVERSMINTPGKIVALVKEKM